MKRKFCRIRSAGLLSANLLLTASYLLPGSWAMAQETSTANTTSTTKSTSMPTKLDEKATIDALYSLSNGCATAADFTKLIAGCESALEQSLSPGSTKYVKSLMSWALNKRGELRLDLHQDFVKIENTQQADKVLSEAATDFQAAWENDDSRWRAWLGKGRIAIIQGNLEEAANCFTRVCELNPKEPIGFFNRAEVFYSLGQFAESRTDYDRVLKFNAADLQGLTGRAHCLSQLGEHEKALEDYDVVCRMRPADPVAFLNRGEALVECQEWARAISDLELAVAKGNDVAMLRLSWILASCPDPQFCNAEMALSLAEQSMQNMGESTETLTAMSHALAATGDQTQADEFQNRATALSSFKEVPGDDIKRNATLPRPSEIK
jgi:tetratricopeptide (TPR) repeat protein